MEEKLKKIDKEIEEKELDLAIKYNEGYTDDSQEIKDINEELNNLYKTRQEIAIQKDKKEIQARIEKYKEQQREIWEDGPDVISDKNRREFDRINNVMATLEELLNKHPNSKFVALEDVNAIIYDGQQEMNEIWRDVSARGDGATPEENARLTKLGDIVAELKDLSKTQEKDTKKEGSTKEQEPTGQAKSGYAEPLEESKQEEAKQTSEPEITEGIAKEEVQARIEKYKEQQREIWADGPDVISDKNRREFDRINNVMATLEELLNKHPNSKFVALEDVNAIIYDGQQEMNEIWRDVSARGDGATPEENARLTKLGDIVAELKDLSKTQEKDTKKEGSTKEQEPTGQTKSGYAEGGFQPPAVQEFQPPAVQEFQPPKPLKFPQLDLNINKKTGEVLLVENGDKVHPFVTYMDAYDYTKEGQAFWKKLIETEQNVAEEDKKYLESVDPTIYNAYREWDEENAEDFDKSAAKMYVESVITRAKNLDKDQDLQGVEMPGEVTVDIGWHRGKNKRPDDVKKFSLRNLMASHKANKIFKQHDKKHMDLATVKSNRWKWLALAGTAIATLVGGAKLAQLGQGNDAPMQPKKEVSMESLDKNPIKTKETQDNSAIETTPAYNPTVNDKTQNEGTQTQSKSARIQLGDIITPEQYAMVFDSSDAKQAKGAMGDVNQAYGVNKMAVVVGDKIYSTDEYSVDELYDMAQNNPNASIRWHVAKAMEMNGKMVVETHEKGNPSPTYIYNDNGTAKTVDGRNWNGIVEFGTGWMNAADMSKANETEIQATIAKQKNSPEQQQVKTQSKKRTATRSQKTEAQQTVMPQETTPNQNTYVNDAVKEELHFDEEDGKLNSKEMLIHDEENRREFDDIEHEPEMTERRKGGPERDER